MGIKYLGKEAFNTLIEKINSLMSNETPRTDGIANAGTSKKISRVDHIHPKDDTKVDLKYFDSKKVKYSGITAESVEEIWNGILNPGPKYGVSGVGDQSTILTRLWDAVGLTAAAGTDTEAPKNDFDNIAPFNRKKCVGTWSEPDSSGKAHFTVNAYADDDSYTEDGTMGDYVAVEIEPLWYYQDLDEGILGISGTPQYDDGWRVHPVCVDEDGNIRAKTYLPCYSLAVNEEGHAVSLPGYHPSFGSYKGLRDSARTYGGGNTAAHLEPMAVRHYEWLLFTIEYATMNCQTVMQGASLMPYSANDKVSVSGTGVNHVIVTAEIGNEFIVGQTIYLGTTYSTTPSSISSYNVITAIENCDISGTVTENGEYRKITFDGTPRNVTAGTTTISSRPWKTGSCMNVKTPTGSPVSNTDGKHTMRYRWRENVWANQFSTCNDLFATLEGAGTIDNPYHILWYYLIDPTYYPASGEKPDQSDFATDAFVRLTQDTEHKSGYIKTMEADFEHPHCIVPTVMTGASNNTYYADYGYIVNGTGEVRAVGFGAGLSNGGYAGLLYFHAAIAPGASRFFSGGGLYFKQ